LDLSDEESWKRTVLVLLTISVAVFVVQRAYFMFLNPVFEFCVFHMTTVASIAIYVYVSRKKKAGQVHG
jgi:uncharacterized membrane protein